MSSTNKTTYYNLSQFANTDKPSWLNDYNNDMTIIDTNLKASSNNVGDLTNLTTTSKTNVVSAINEVDSNTDTNTTSIGDLTSLTTTAKTDLVSAINEVASSSGGSCKLHFLDVSNYSSSNPLYFDTLELGSYILYNSNQNQGGISPIVITFKGKTGSTGSATVSTYDGAILNYFIDINTITNTSKCFASCSYTGGTLSAPTIYYFSFKLSNTSTGRIDYNLISSMIYTNSNKTSIATGYDASKTQTLKNVNGTLKWVDDV